MSHDNFQGIMATELIKRLNEHIQDYGDFPVKFGDFNPEKKKIIDLPISGFTLIKDDLENKEWYRLTWGFCLMEM